MKHFLVVALAGTALGVGAILVAANTGNAPVASRPAAEIADTTVQVAATQRTVTLSVDNMFCALCPYIVRRALENVPGVIAANVSFRDRLAVVTYDSARTDEFALVSATSEAGYPSEAISR